MTKRKAKNRPGKQFHLIIHPFLAAVYPIVFLTAYNIKETYVGNMTGALIMSLLAVIAVFFALNFFIKDPLKAGLITTAAVMVFFSYGRIFTLLNDVEIADVKIFSHIVLVPLLILLAYLAVDALIRAKKLPQINFILNIIFALLTVFVCGQTAYGVAVYHRAALDAIKQKADLAISKSGTAVDRSKQYPDIYYIILDAHLRRDVGMDMYDYDDSGFLKHLEDRGFYVAKQSRPNYCQTALSLASSMNMEYLDDAADKNTKGNLARIYLGEMIRRNRLVETLRKYGYIWVSYFTGFVETELKGIADIYLPQGDVYADEMTEFNSILMDSTLISGIEGILNMRGGKKLGPFVAFQRRTQYILENIDKSADITSPKIVFAHLICPHPPFVFDENGPTDKYMGTAGVEFAGGDQNPMPKDQYRKAYRAQVIYLDREMCGVVDRLLAATKGKAIIIIQADHGPGSEWFVNSYEKTNKKERFAILNAYYLPGGMEKYLYESISPVNSFRLILQHYFGLDTPLLPDKSYYSTWNEPFRFIEVPQTN